MIIIIIIIIIMMILIMITITIFTILIIADRGKQCVGKGGGAVSVLGRSLEVRGLPTTSGGFRV